MKPAHESGRPAALLLEVVIALAIIMVVFAVLGAQLNSGLKMVAQAEEITRAAQLADRMMAVVELEPNTVENLFEQREMDGDFGDQFPGWFWRARIEPVSEDDETLGRVTIEILHQTDPDLLDGAEGARVVRTLHLLKANPAKIDLAKDFGVPPEQLEMLAAIVPLPGFDPSAIDPLALVSLDPETLMQLLPVLLPLLQQFQFAGVDLPGGLTPDKLQEMLESGNLGDLAAMFGGSGAGQLGDLGAMLGGMSGGAMGGDADALRELIKSSLGDQISDAQLDALLGTLGSGAGAAGPPGGGSSGSLRDLDRLRDERNSRFDKLVGPGGP